MSAHRFERPTEDVPEFCTCGAAFVEGHNLQAVKAAHLAAFGVQPEADSRTYVVGLPVIVTVSPEGFVTVEVDTAELGAAIRDDDQTEHTDEQAEADAATADAWTDTHTVRNEGYAR